MNTFSFKNDFAIPCLEATNSPAVGVSADQYRRLSANIVLHEKTRNADHPLHRRPPSVDTPRAGRYKHDTCLNIHPCVSDDAQRLRHSTVRLTSHAAWRSRWLRQYFFADINFKGRKAVGCRGRRVCARALVLNAPSLSLFFFCLYLCVFV